MKQFITCLLLFTNLLMSGQTEYPRIDKIEVKDKMLSGDIDNKPVTIYLKYYKTSEDNLIYSLTGWLSNQKDKKKTPLYGIANNSRELILYNFEDYNLANRLINFQFDFSWDNLDEKLDTLFNNFKEKITINDQSSIWTNKQKTLPINLSYDNLEIKKTFEFLRFSLDNTFNLTDLGPYNFSIIANNGLDYILEYNYELSGVGQCGNSVENGFVLLEFDKNLFLKNSEEFINTSCIKSIYCDQLKINDHLTAFSYEDYENKTVRTFIVDTEKVQITWIKTAEALDELISKFKKKD